MDQDCPKILLYHNGATTPEEIELRKDVITIGRKSGKTFNAYYYYWILTMTK
jgi:hypothetical protein